MNKITCIIETCIIDFCKEFLDNPYLCYTEHGLHARFYYGLLKALPEELSYTMFNGKKICTVQKEYRTRTDLGKDWRQNWDIAIIDVNVNSNLKYDYLPLHSVIEFGLNVGKEHLREDLRRLKHKESNVTNRYIVHLYRINKGFSGRDISSNNKKNMEITDIEAIYKDLKSVNNLGSEDVRIYYAKADCIKSTKDLWIVTNYGKKIEQIKTL